MLSNAWEHLSQTFKEGNGVRRGPGDRHADGAHINWQPRLRYGDAVLHLHLGDVEIGAEIEAYRDGETPIRRRVRYPGGRL